MHDHLRPFIIVWLVLNVYFLILPPVVITPVWYVLGSAVFVSWLMLVSAVWRIAGQMEREKRDPSRTL